MAKPLKNLGFSIFRQRNGELFRNLTLDQIRKTIDAFVCKDFTEFICSLVYVTTHENYPDRLAAFDMMYDIRVAAVASNLVRNDHVQC
jgi:hypothetical protein